MFTEFLVLLIYFSSCECQTPGGHSVEVPYNSRIIEKPLPSQSGVLVRRNAELAGDTQSNNPKVFICCERKKFFESKNDKCSSTLEETINGPEFPPIYTGDLEKSDKSPWTHFDIHYDYPCKHKSYTLESGPPHYDVFYILENGSILLDNSLLNKSNSMENNDAYCLANMKRNNKTYSVIRYCFPEQKAPKEIPLVYPITMAVSIPLLVATFLVYACLPELRNIHGLTLMAYVACLCAAYISLSVTQFGGIKVVEMSTLCISLAFTIHFFFLASFFWLNVMCFDIWWTFGGFRSLQGSVSQRERKKFIIYSLYAWGCASLLTGICLILDLVPGIPENIIKPQFGERKCWFSDRKAMAIYFHGPMGVTIVCNIFLFISTALKIHQHTKDTELQLRGADSRRHDDNKQWFNLYLKLFIVMGINWSMEIISWFFTDQNAKQDLDYIWIIPDLMNTLQGVIIFIIFVWKDKVRRLLLKRIGWGNRSSRSTSSTRTHSSTSRTVITNTMLAPLQDKLAPRQKEKFLSTDESDCL